MNTLPARLANVEAECSILSAAVYRKDWLLDVLQNVNVDDFTRNETRAIFSVIQKMYERGEDISLGTVSMHQKELEDAGYIQGRDMTFSQMIGNPPMSREISPYISTLKEMSTRRLVYRAAQTAIHYIDSGEMSSVAFDELERAVIERTATGMKRELLTPNDMAKAIENTVKECMDAESRKKKVIYTQYGQLNICTGGFSNGELIILSAESGTGKSAFAMNLAGGIAITNHKPLLYLNSEMLTEQNALRWAAYLSQVSHSALRSGKETEDDAKKAISTSEAMRNGKLYTLNIPDMQIVSVLSELRRMKAKYDISIAIVDYIGRMDTMNLRDAREWQVMKSAAQKLKTIAMELQIPIIMVAQLTADGGRLAQSSYMAHEADLWINLSRINDEGDLKKYWPWNYKLTFRKARNVECGKEIMLRFDGDHFTFIGRKKDAEEIAGARPLDAGAKTTKATGKDVPM